jgi:microcystin-dependent protein
MGMANIPDDWLGEYKDYIVRWPTSEQWDAVLRGQLTAPAFTDFWDRYSGDPSSSVSAMDETFDTNLHLEEGAMLPAGMIIDFAGTVIPDGWEICDFGELDRIEFARLYAVVGTIYGPGDGTTTFNKPPASGRVNVALDPTDADFNALGEFRGVKSVILEVSELPAHSHLQDAHNHLENAHNHSQNAHNHTQNPHDHTIDGLVNALSGSARRTLATVSTGDSNILSRPTTATNIQTSASNISTTATNIEATATNQNTGGDAGHDNIQPSIVFYRLIKT